MMKLFFDPVLAKVIDVPRSNRKVRNKIKLLCLLVPMHPCFTTVY